MPTTDPSDFPLVASDGPAVLHAVLTGAGPLPSRLSASADRPLGTLTVQVLLAARRAGIGAALDGPGPTLRAGLVLLGLDDLLADGAGGPAGDGTGRT